jgi:hypothetical protein
MTPEDPKTTSDVVELMGLISRYAIYIDTANFTAFAELFRHGRWGACNGYDETLAFMENHIILYPDGTPRTMHCVSNVAIDVAGDEATAESYASVFQQLDLSDPITTIAGVHYHDTFKRREDGWAFDVRDLVVRLTTSQSDHLRNVPAGLLPD